MVYTTSENFNKLTKEEIMAINTTMITNKTINSFMTDVALLEQSLVAPISVEYYDGTTQAIALYPYDSPLQETIINANFQYKQLNNKLQISMNHVQYSFDDHTECDGLHKEVEGIWKRWSSIEILRDKITKKRKNLERSLTSSQIEKLDEIDNLYENFRDVISDDFITLYHNVDTLLTKYDGLAYFVNLHRHAKSVKELSSIQEKSKIFSHLTVANKTLKTLNSLVASNRDDLMFLQRENIIKTCASDFATYMLTRLVADRKTNNVKNLVDSYFFGDGSSSGVYNLACLLIKKYGTSSDRLLHQTFLMKNSALNTYYIKSLNALANSIIFDNATLQEKIEAYTLLMESIKYYNRIVKGLLGKCTYKDYSFSDDQKKQFTMFAGKEIEPTFANLLSMIKDQYSKDSKTTNITNFVEYIVSKYSLEEQADIDAVNELEI